MRISSLSDQNGREYNQDRRIVVPKTFAKGNSSAKKVLFCMVADGMGGTDAGGEASRIATEYFEKWVEYEMSNNLLENGSSSVPLRESIEKAFSQINEDILAYGRENKVSLGTTAVILILFKDEFLVANLGDSRAYRFSKMGKSSPLLGNKNAKLQAVRITRDQTAIQSSIDRGIISEEEAKKSKLSHVLTSCLGMKPSRDGKVMMRPEFYRGTFKKGDHFLLCSDGLYNRVDTPEMAEVIKKDDLSTKEKLMELFILSKQTGEKDNITGILVEV